MVLGWNGLRRIFEMIPKCVLALSSVNATPERGFSINAKLLDTHGYSTGEDTIIAIRHVKDKIHKIGDATTMIISRDLIDL